MESFAKAAYDLKAFERFSKASKIKSLTDRKVHGVTKDSQPDPDNGKDIK